jgi:hypothetical protein
MPLRGKVAAIVSDESVIINLGSSQGVKPGMHFMAVLESGEVRDPDNADRVLGELRYEIARLQATNVMANMSICSVPTAPPSLSTNSLIADFMKSTSKVDPTAKRLLDPTQMTIKVGTVVVEFVPEPPTPPRPSGLPKLG